jgi:hypothetical protein
MDIHLVSIGTYSILWCLRGSSWRQRESNHGAEEANSWAFVPLVSAFSTVHEPGEHERLCGLEFNPQFQCKPPLLQWESQHRLAFVSSRCESMASNAILAWLQGEPSWLWLNPHPSPSWTSLLQGDLLYMASCWASLAPWFQRGSTWLLDEPIRLQGESVPKLQNEPSSAVVSNQGKS